MIIFNEETKDIVDEKHICYYTKNRYQKIELYQVYEKKLLHPKAKEHAFVFKIDTRRIKEFDRIEIEASASVLLEAAQNNIVNERR